MENEAVGRNIPGDDPAGCARPGRPDSAPGFLRAFLEQEVTETTEKAPALCSLRFLLFTIPGFIGLRPKAALVNRDPAGSASASRSPLGRGETSQSQSRATTKANATATSAKWC